MKWRTWLMLLSLVIVAGIVAVGSVVAVHKLTAKQLPKCSTDKSLAEVIAGQRRQ